MTRTGRGATGNTAGSSAGGQRTSDHPFFVGNNRAMVSLGPLSEVKYCPYSCQFCYVQADFKSYATMGIPDIVSFLREIENQFDVIYVSGDTDSFAPPRTNQGIALLEALADEFDCDLMFTTRALFERGHLVRLAEIQKIMLAKDRFFYGCVSISRLRSAPESEPRPIPQPEDRMKILQAFWQRGIVAVLAMRPFLPTVAVSEYLEILDRCRAFVDVVLGEALYLDPGGIIESRMYGGPAPLSLLLEPHRMDFDDNEASWKVWEAKDYEAAVEAHCRRLGLPFFMRSRPAIEHVRSMGTDFLRQRAAY